MTVDVLITNKNDTGTNGPTKQLEQATADLTTRLLLNDSLVLYIDTSEPTISNSLELMEHTKLEHDTSKTPTPPDDTDRTHATLPPPKKRFEIVKDPVFLSAPIYPPSYLQNLHFLQIVMIISSHSFLTMISSSKHN